MRRQFRRLTDGDRQPTSGVATGRASSQRRNNSFDMMRSTLSPPRRHRRNAFTLIEMMVVMAVAAILVAVALPSFLDSMRKGRRAEAVTALAQVQQAQERWRANNPTYTITLSDLKGVNLDGAAKTPSGYYTVSLNDAAASPTGYTASAVAVSGTSQAHDSQCSTMRVRMQGGNIQYGGCAGCALPAGALTDPNRCWSR
jgi:type IV pilus assembly protein PilE